MDGPELDYAFLAEFAKVELGRLTVVAASFTHVRVPGLPQVLQIAVAGRVRVPVGFGDVSLRFEISAPDRQAVLTFDAALTTDPTARQYREREGRLFALNTGLPVVSPGLCQVVIQLEGTEVRRLAFEVEIASE